MWILLTDIQNDLRLDNSLKLPLIRTTLWTLLLLADLFSEPNIDGDASYLLYLTNTALCTFWQTIFRLTSESIMQLPFVYDFFLNIILFGLYQIGIIKTATFIYDRIIRKQKQS